MYITLSLLSILIIVSYSYSNKEEINYKDNQSDKKPNILLKKQSPIYDSNIGRNNKPIIKKKLVDKPLIIKNIRKYKNQIKNQEIILTKKYNILNKYTVSLKSHKRATQMHQRKDYINIYATLKEYDNEDKVNLSFNKYYAQYTQDLFVEVINKESNIAIICDGSFLNGVSMKYSYQVQLNIMGDILSCYISSQKEKPIFSDIPGENFLKGLDNKSINLKNRERLKIPEKAY